MARSRAYHLLRSSVKVWQSLTRQGTQNGHLWPTASRMISRPPPALNRRFACPTGRLRRWASTLRDSHGLGLMAAADTSRPR
jgi:hypothetical protein